MRHDGETVVFILKNSASLCFSSFFECIPTSFFVKSVNRYQLGGSKILAATQEIRSINVKLHISPTLPRRHHAHRIL